MSPQLAQFILEACNNADTFFQDEESIPELYSGLYSGRSMFGDKTTAIVCGNIMPVMAAVACEIVERLGYDNDTDDAAAELQDMLEEIRHLQTDSMGCDSIVLY